MKLIGGIEYMNLTWKYKSELSDDGVFEEIAKKYGLDVPEDLKALIKEANGATPDKIRVDIGNKERVFGALLSFNEGDPDDVYTVLDSIGYKNFIPFGVDPFGNYYCYHVKKHEVYFWDHEEDRMERSGYNLEEFLEKLY